MAITAFWYTNGPKHAVTDVLWLTDTIKVALTDATYTPNQDTHEFFSSVTGELATAAGYTAGGQALGTKSVTADASTNETRLIAATSSWTVPSGQTLTAHRAVVYKDTGVAGTSPLLGWVDLGADFSASGGTFALVWDATHGVLKVTAS